MIPPAATILFAAGLACAATIKVEVGKGGLVFSPSETKAAVNDVLEFHFVSGNHSVVQGDFDNACHPSTTGGFFSGYFPATSGENADVFSVTINNTDPVALYCSQDEHCLNGMVAVISPSSSNSFANYEAAAKSATEVTEPSTVFGGTVGPAASGTSSASSPSGTSSSPTAASSTAATRPNEGCAVGASLGGIAAALGFAMFLV